MVERRDLLKDQAYRNLKALIVEGAIPPGAFLSERQLVEQLGMSKTPIRAALERLEQDGFVKTSPQQGVVVREMALKEIVDHYDIRIALETFVVERLYPSGELLEALRVNLAEQAQQLDANDFHAYTTLDGDFHLMLCEGLNNREIVRVMQHQRDKLQRVTHHVLARDPRRMRVSHQQHLAIVEALAQGDHTAAVERMREHLDSGKRFLVSL